MTILGLKFGIGFIIFAVLFGYLGYKFGPRIASKVS